MKKITKFVHFPIDGMPLGKERGPTHLDMDLFIEVSSILDKLSLEKIDLEKFQDILFAVMFKRKKNIYSLLQILPDENTYYINPYTSAAKKLYYHTYMANRKYKHLKKTHSPEEIFFLHFLKELNKLIKDTFYRGKPYHTERYHFENFLKHIMRFNYFLIDYLHELGFKGKPKGIKFKKYLKKYDTREDDEVKKVYGIISGENMKNSSVHEVILNLRKSIFD